MKDDRAYLLHIRDAAARILEYTREGPVRLLSDPRIEDIPIVSAALEGGADHLVTDDSGLLEVKTLIVSGYRSVQVTAPGPFLTHALGRSRM